MRVPVPEFRWRTLAVALAAASGSPAQARQPLPPTPAQLETARECRAYAPPERLHLALRPVPPPRAPAELGVEWSVRIDTGGRDLGSPVGLVWLMPSGWTDGSTARLRLLTDGGWWIDLPLAGKSALYLRPAQLGDGRPLPGAGATAVPVRELPGKPIAAVSDGASSILVTDGASLVTYDSAACGPSARPEPASAPRGAGRIIGLNAIGGRAEVRREVAAGLASAGLVVRSDFPLARGCDRFDLVSVRWRAAVEARTWCSPGFDESERAASLRPSRRRRVPAAVARPRRVGIVEAPIRAMATGYPDFDQALLESASDHRRDPGVLEWVYMVSQTRGGAPLEVHGFHMRRAYYPLGPGGVREPTPPVS